MNPVVSVLIPTKNRRDLLARAIRSALAQTVPVEVFVLDDGSTDDTQAFVAAEFPQVRYFREEVSRGPTFERNKGADAATAPFLLTLDDDCELVSPETLAACLDEFDHARIGAVTIPYINIRQDAIVRGAAPPGGGRWATLLFTGGMIVFRREAYLRAGGYRPTLFMHVEESDLAVRLLASGFLVRLGAAAPLHHHESPVRDLRRLHVLGARNHVLFAWHNVPQPYLLPHLAVTSVRCAALGVRIRHPLLIARGLLQGYRECVSGRAARQPVARAVYTLSRRLKRAPLPLETALSLLPE